MAIEILDSSIGNGNFPIERGCWFLPIIPLLPLHHNIIYYIVIFVVFPLKMLVFHSYVNVYQRINSIKSHQTTIILWFSHGFPIGNGFISGPPAATPGAALPAASCLLRSRRGSLAGRWASAAPLQLSVFLIHCRYILYILFMCIYIYIICIYICIYIYMYIYIYVYI